MAWCRVLEALDMALTAGVPGHDSAVAQGGRWLLELLDGLGLEQVDVVGASFGGILAVKLAAAAPGRVRSATLMAPAGLQSVSLWSMGDNLLPLVWSSEANVRRFLERVVFTRTHTLEPERYQLLMDYQVHAITRFKSRAQLPYRMTREELAALTVPAWLLIGERDPMFPHARSEKRARADLPGLQEVILLADHGHGVETSLEATGHLQRILGR